MLEMSSAATVRSTSDAVVSFTELDYSEISAVPERRIWMACIIEFIREYENIVQRITKLVVQPGIANLKLRWELEREFYQAKKWLKSEDFQDVCNYAEFSPNRVKQKMKEINAQYKLEAIQWIQQH